METRPSSAAAGSFTHTEPVAAQAVAIEHAVNMLMARIAFDLLRSPRFKQYVMAYVQKKLDDLKAPDYINALQVGSSTAHKCCLHFMSET